MKPIKKKTKKRKTKVKAKNWMIMIPAEYATDDYYILKFETKEKALKQLEEMLIDGDSIEDTILYEVKARYEISPVVELKQL